MGSEGVWGSLTSYVPLSLSLLICETDNKWLAAHSGWLLKSLSVIHGKNLGYCRWSPNGSQCGTCLGFPLVHWSFRGGATGGAQLSTALQGLGEALFEGPLT